jgi:hypothetical protein
LRPEYRYRFYDDRRMGFFQLEPVAQMVRAVLQGQWFESTLVPQIVRCL